MVWRKKVYQSSTVDQAGDWAWNLPVGRQRSYQLCNLAHSLCLRDTKSKLTRVRPFSSPPARPSPVKRLQLFTCDPGQPNTIPYHTIPYHTITIPYHTIQYNTIQHNTNFICHFCFRLYKNCYINYLYGVNSGEAAVKKPQGLLVTAASFVDYLLITKWR